MLQMKTFKQNKMLLIPSLLALCLFNIQHAHASECLLQDSTTGGATSGGFSTRLAYGINASALGSKSVANQCTPKNRS